MNAPKLQCTRNYELSDAHEYNRPLRDDPYLERSMRERGFMPSSPIHVIRGGDGKLKIVRGHKRFAYAKRLGLAVYYVLDDSASEPWDLEAGFGPHWSQRDYVYAHAQTGKPDYRQVLDFADEHHLAMGVAVSLLGGQSDTSATNLKTRVRTGTFIVTDEAHAQDVGDLVECLAESGIVFARQSPFVIALSKCLRVAEFDADSFTHKMRLHGHRLSKRSTVDDYVDEIEAAYNYAAKASLRLPLAIRVRQVMAERNPGARARKGRL